MAGGEGVQGAAGGAAGAAVGAQGCGGVLVLVLVLGLGAVGRDDVHPGAGEQRAIAAGGWAVQSVMRLADYGRRYLPRG